MLYCYSASVAKKTLVFSYGRSFNGFAAKLTDEEATRISGATFLCKNIMDVRGFLYVSYTNKEFDGM